MTDPQVPPVSPQLQSQIIEWRRKSLSGDITLDEMKLAIIALRSNRRAAAEASASSGKKKTKVPVNTDDLLSELGSI